MGLWWLDCQRTRAAQAEKGYANVGETQEGDGPMKPRLDPQTMHFPSLDPDAMAMLRAFACGDSPGMDGPRDWLMERGFDQLDGKNPHARLWVAIEACQGYMGGKWSRELLPNVFLFMQSSWWDVHDTDVWVQRKRISVARFLLLDCYERIQVHKKYQVLACLGPKGIRHTIDGREFYTHAYWRPNDRPPESH